MVRNEIRDSFNYYIGWSEDDTNEIRYWGITQGLIGKYDKTAKRYIYMKPPKIGQFGPYCDIGTSEVLKYEKSR